MRAKELQAEGLELEGLIDKLRVSQGIITTPGRQAPRDLPDPRQSPSPPALASSLREEESSSPLSGSRKNPPLNGDDGATRRFADATPGPGAPDAGPPRVSKGEEGVGGSGDGGAAYSAVWESGLRASHSWKFRLTFDEDWSEDVLKAGGSSDLAASLAAKLGVPITHMRVEGSHCHMGGGGGFGGDMVRGQGGQQLGSLVVAFQVIAGPEMKGRLEAVTEAVVSGTPPVLPIAGRKTNVSHISQVQSREMAAGYEMGSAGFFGGVAAAT